MPEPGLRDYIRRLSPGTYGSEVGETIGRGFVRAAQAARPYVAPPPQMQRAPQVVVPQSSPERHVRRAQRDYANASYDYEQDQKAVLDQLADFLTFRDTEQAPRGK